LIIVAPGTPTSHCSCNQPQRTRSHLKIRSCTLRSALLHRRQGTSSGRVRVQYINSNPNSLSRTWLNKQITWIEVCSAYPWGHRADRTHYNDPCGGAHICWEDLAECCKDRPFAHDHCTGGASWCPVYGRSRSWFGNRGGRRGGYVQYASLRVQSSCHCPAAHCWIAACLLPLQL